MNRKSIVTLLLMIQTILFATAVSPVLAAENGGISGSVYHDSNGNAMAEPGEANLPDTTVYIQQAGRSTPIVLVTNADGYFVSGALPYATYEVWAVDTQNHWSTVQVVVLDEVTGASIVEVPIVYDLSNDVEFLSVPNIFLPFVNR